MLAAMIKEKKEEPRLWSKQPRLPADVVAQEHRGVHALLERWGAWNRERYQQGTCASLESNYDNSGAREVKRPTVALPPDPRLRRIEEVVVAMMQDRSTEQHGETLREFYCKRWALKTICWAHALQYEDFGRWMYDCRAMVLNATAGAS